MTVKDLIAYLQTQDQDAICQYLDCDEYGNGTWKDLKEDNLYYMDLRGNPYVKPGAPHENKRCLQIGS